MWISAAASPQCRHSITGVSPSLPSCLVYTQQPVDPVEVKDLAVSPWMELLNNGSMSLVGWFGLPRVPQPLALMQHSPAHVILLHLMHTLWSRGPAYPKLSSVTPLAVSLTIFRCFSVSFSRRPMVFPLLKHGSHPSTALPASCPTAWSPPAKSSPPFASFSKNIHWNIVDLKCCAGFCWIPKLISYTYAYIHFFRFFSHWVEFPVLYSRSL